MNSNLNGKMSVILGIFPASIGKKTYFFALGTIPETGVGFIGRKSLYVYVKYHHKFIPGTRECISGLLRKIFVFKVGKPSFLHLSESPYLSGMVTGLSIVTR